MVKIVSLILCVFLLCSCSVAHKIVTKPVEKPALNLDQPAQLRLKPVRIVVLTKENANDVLQELESRGIEPVVFSLTGNDYKSLSTNLEDIKNYIKLQQKIILLYKDYYEGDQNERKEK